MEKVCKLSLQAFCEHVYGLGAPPSTISYEPGYRFAHSRCRCIKMPYLHHFQGRTSCLQTAVPRSQVQEAHCRRQHRSKFALSIPVPFDVEQSIGSGRADSVLTRVIGLMIDVLGMLGCVEGSRLPRRVLPCRAGICSEKTLARQVPRPWTSSS